MLLVIFEKDGVSFCKVLFSDVILVLFKFFVVIMEIGMGLFVMWWCVFVLVIIIWFILVKLFCSLIRRFFLFFFVVIDLGV